MKIIKTLSILLLSYLSIVMVNAQSYKIEDNNVSQPPILAIRPSISFFIPGSELVDGFGYTINGEAQYWMEKMDLRAGIYLGKFNGISAGGTYHMFSGLKSKNYKFVLSRTKSGNVETTKYFKAKADVNVISGPCADISLGALQKAGFFPKLEIGWDFQHLARATAVLDNNSRINGSRNGWISFKTQIVMASMNVDATNYFGLGAGTSKYTEERKLAVGLQASLSAATRPWNKICFYASLQMGAMKILGVSDLPDTTPRTQPIVNFALGAQLYAK